MLSASLTSLHVRASAILHATVWKSGFSHWSPRFESNTHARDLRSNQSRSSTEVKTSLPQIWMRAFARVRHHGKKCIGKVSHRICNGRLAIPLIFRAAINTRSQSAAQRPYPLPSHHAVSTKISIMLTLIQLSSPSGCASEPVCTQPEEWDVPMCSSSPGSH